MVSLAARDGVLWQGAPSPSVGTAHTMNIQVDVEVDKTSALNLVGMVGMFEVFLAVVPRTDAEGLQSLDVKR